MSGGSPQPIISAFTTSSGRIRSGSTRRDATYAHRSRTAAHHVRRDKAALFQWVQAPPGDRSSRKRPDGGGAGYLGACLVPPERLKDKRRAGLLKAPAVGQSIPA